MPAATLTRKGQTTIPKVIRDHLHLRPGDRLEFVLEDDGKVMLIPAVVDAKDLKGILPPPRKSVTIDDMKRAIRKRGSRL